MVGGDRARPRQQEFSDLLGCLDRSELGALGALLTCMAALNELTPEQVSSIQGVLNQCIERRLAQRV